MISSLCDYEVSIVGRRKIISATCRPCFEKSYDPDWFIVFSSTYCYCYCYYLDFMVWSRIACDFKMINDASLKKNLVRSERWKSSPRLRECAATSGRTRPSKRFNNSSSTRELSRHIKNKCSIVFIRKSCKSMLSIRARPFRTIFSSNACVKKLSTLSPYILVIISKQLCTISFSVRKNSGNIGSFYRHTPNKTK